MKALLLVDEAEDNIRLADLDKPTLGPNEVLIKMRAAGGFWPRAVGRCKKGSHKEKREIGLWPKTKNSTRAGYYFGGGARLARPRGAPLADTAVELDKLGAGVAATVAPVDPALGGGGCRCR